jgi:hypothetical protein
MDGTNPSRSGTLSLIYTIHQNLTALVHPPPGNKRTEASPAYTAATMAGDGPIDISGRKL